MRHDWLAIDAEVRAALLRWRSCDPTAAANPLPLRLLHPERLEELAEDDDAAARAQLPWLRMLAAERAAWPARAERARRWRTLQRNPRSGEEHSLWQLRRRLLLAELAGERERAAADFALQADDLSALSQAHLAERFERDDRSLGGQAFVDVAGAEAGSALAAAEWVLRRSQDAADSFACGSWAASLQRGIGSAAGEGWPARLTQRWLAGVFGASGLLDGVRMARQPSQPQLWGATSFARALAELGAALLVAGRPQGMLLGLHMQPYGLRRSRRRALFGGLILEPAFARKVQGLGQDRAERQLRTLARAALCGVRLDALRVCLLAALRQGRGEARERYHGLSKALFGQPAPLALLAVLPQLRPGSAAALLGTLQAALQREALVEAHDVDWFRNPRAALILRQADGLRRPEQDVGAAAFEAGAERLIERIESLL